MRIILLNGPPRCGKDFAAQQLSVHVIGGIIVKFADALKDATHRVLGVDVRDGEPVWSGHYEDVKDRPDVEGFHGKSPRQWYIAVSEHLFKPMAGERVWGEILGNRIDNALGRGQMLRTERTFLVPDSGFRPEAEVLVDRFGADACTLIRIARDGCSFEGDSRSYIDLADLGVQCHDVVNDGGMNFVPRLLTALGTPS